MAVVADPTVTSSQRIKCNWIARDKWNASNFSYFSPFLKYKQPRRLVLRSVSSISTNVKQHSHTHPLRNISICVCVYPTTLHDTIQCIRKVYGHVEKYIDKPTRGMNAVNMFEWGYDIAYSSCSSFSLFRWISTVFYQFDRSNREMKIVFKPESNRLAA